MHIDIDLKNVNLDPSTVAEVVQTEMLHMFGAIAEPQVSADDRPAVVRTMADIRPVAVHLVMVYGGKQYLEPPTMVLALGEDEAVDLANSYAVMDATASITVYRVEVIPCLALIPVKEY